jgi:hypothetical protein
VIPRARDIRLTACEIQVSGLNILHSYRFLIFGQGRYGGSYRGFRGVFARGGPQCAGDSVKGARVRAPVH